MTDTLQTNPVLVIDLWWQEYECRICGFCFAVPPSAPSYGVPMYEEYCVPPEWDGEWGGFPACKDCFDKYERGELPTWTVEQLRHVTRTHSNEAPVKHILRLVTYGALKPSKWEHGRPSRAREPVDDYRITVTPRQPLPEFIHTQGTADKRFRLVGIARYPDRVEARYERYL